MESFIIFTETPSSVPDGCHLLIVGKHSRQWANGSCFITTAYQLSSVFLGSSLFRTILSLPHTERGWLRKRIYLATTHVVITSFKGHSHEKRDARDFFCVFLQLLSLCSESFYCCSIQRKWGYFILPETIQKESTAHTAALL